MRFLTLKTIVILTIIAIGFMVTEPFVEKTAEANCDTYSEGMCDFMSEWCEERRQWADFNCPGANDAGVDRCNELTEEAELICDVAALICYHSSG